ncbi:universal stress protein [Planctomonas sp. JC2975]|uniref:universal stress protein n=1 Tax=Planctomonas sp. JC2975 TaxID=2729626 RepID=UPI001475FF8D|nr:universal stress protein [Planctomonas sp. JC2975]NNC12146.1 universal stress protein [Planctomonas sp. JC2975]
MSETTETTAATADDTPRIVVGVDGSEQSIAALRQADRLSRLLGTRIEAVSTWTYPVAMSPYALSMEPSFEEIAVQALDEALTEAYGSDRPALLSTVVQYGHPAQVLIERSTGAEMLVLGSRGRGGFAGLLLGSVSSECAAHANCPVLIVR